MAGSIQQNGCRAFILLGSALLALAGVSVAHAHGGDQASAFILDPEQPGVVVDGRFEFRWFDASDLDAATASTTHSFYYSSFLPPPWPTFVGPQGLEGTPIVENIPESAPENRFTWDTSNVAPGAYWLWSIASDPDLEIPSQSIVFSPFPVVVAGAGDPVSPFVTLQTPDSPAALAEDDKFTVEYSVFDPDQSAVLRLERAFEDDGGGAPTDFQPIDVTLDPEATEVVIDTSTWPEQDRYVLRLHIEDGRGLTFSSFARYGLLVPRRTRPPAPSPEPDPEPEPTPDPTPGNLRPEVNEASNSGCRGQPPSNLSLLLALLLPWLLRRRTQFGMNP